MSGAVSASAGRATRSPVLGIVAVVIAVESVSALLLPNPVVEGITRLVGNTESAAFAVLFLLLNTVGLVAVVLGLVAALTRRGRSWGITAVVLTIVGNIWFLELARGLLGAG